MVAEDRIRRLEADIESLSERLVRLERRGAAGASAGAQTKPTAVTPAPTRPQPVRISRVVAAPEAPTAVEPAPPPAPTPGRELEDLLGGRVLAWVGGLAVLVGIVFLVAVAISRGWIGETERTLLAAMGSLVLLAVGVRAHERHGRTDASLTLAAAAIAGLFATVTVATSGYELVPAGAGLVLAFAIGSVATTLAVRWEARILGALGIVGCLLSPMFVSAPASGPTMCFLLIAGASAVGVLLWQRWDWLALAVVSIPAVQWVPWVFDATAADAVVALIAFGALGATAALGYDVRAAGRSLRPTSAAIFAGNALLLVGAGYLSLHDAAGHTAANAWLAGLAAVHLLSGAVTRRSARVSEEMRVVVLGVGVLIADIALGATVRGPALALTWAATGLLFAFLRRRGSAEGYERDMAIVGVGTHVALSLGQTLIHLAPPASIDGGPSGLLAALVALSALAGVCFASGRIAAEGRPEIRVALDMCGLLVVAYETVVALDGLALVVALAAQAAALAYFARSTRDDLAGGAAIAFLAGAAGHAIVFEAPPTALLDGVDPLWPALAATVFVAVVALRCGNLRRDEWRGPLLLAGCTGLLYAASIAVVTAFGGHADVVNGVATAHAQQPQLVLSALWALVGVVALIAGLRRDQSLARRGALALLLVTVGKLFLYDLSALDSVYRVASCIGVGLLLLAGAHAYQRLRPRPAPDLREAPDAVRDGLFARS